MRNFLSKLIAQHRLSGEKRQCAIVVTEYFVVRNILFARGFLDAGSAKLKQCYTILPDGTPLEMTLLQDPYHVAIPGRQSFAISHQFTTLPDQELLFRGKLAFCFGDFHAVVDAPVGNGQEGDKYYTSEKVYWDAVHQAKEGEVLEIGSRARSGISRRSLFPPALKYTGLDISPGENVDVVGDAHVMSQTLPANHYDFVFSISVWEHLMMPWKVSLELNKVMKMGGMGMVCTHQAWPSHEEPWDYFRFSEFCWDSLFNQHTGFEIIDKAAGLRCLMAGTRMFPPVTAGNLEWHYGYLASRVVFKKVADTQLAWPVPLGDLVGGVYHY